LDLGRPRARRRPTALKPASISTQVAGSGITVRLATDWPMSTEPFTGLALGPTRKSAKSMAMAFVVMPSVSVVSGICWFSVTVKPGIVRSTSFAAGVPENVNVCPAILRLRSVIVVEPVAGEVPFTEEVELIVVAVTSKIIPPAGEKEKLSVVEVAVPVSVGGKGELAVSVTKPTDRPAKGRLKEPEFVISYGGGADAVAGATGPTVMGIPTTVNAMRSPVDELEMSVTRALAGETKPTDNANAPIVVKADALNTMT
jgi:hypothetical protein